MVSICINFGSEELSAAASDPVESEIDDIEIDEIESSFEPVTLDKSMDELAHHNRDTINPSLTDLGPMAEETTDDIRLSKLDDIHILMTAEPDLTANSHLLDHPKGEDTNEDTPAAVISDDEDDNPISIREDEAEPSNIAHEINTMFDQGFDYDDELVAITDHRYAGGVLELKVEYSNGEYIWHPISMVS